MEPYFLLSLSAIGALVLFIASIANARLKKIGDTQETHGEKLTTIGSNVTELRAVVLGVNGTPGIAAKVQVLHDERNAAQLRELSMARAEIDRLRAESDR